MLLSFRAQAFRRLLDVKGCASFRRIFAGIAQLVEQLICNQQVVGSNPTAGSLVKRDFSESRKSLLGHLLGIAACPKAVRHSVVSLSTGQITEGKFVP